MLLWKRWRRRDKARCKSSSAVNRARPCLEALETRDCPALALTQAGINAGLSLSVFSYNYPHPGLVGPWGITFPATGGVLVSDSPGNLHYFASDTDGQDAGSVPTQSYGPGNARDIVTINGKNYMGQDAGSNQIEQVNDDGTLNQVIVSSLPGHSFGMVADPANGHVFVSIELDKSNSEIVDVDPIAHTWKKFVKNGLMDGITISADGSTLYAARRTDDHIVGFATSTGNLVFDSGFVAGGPDGITVGTGLYTQFLVVNTNAGTVIGINLNTKHQTVVADGGSRGDFARTDYRNGSFLVSQTAEVDRISFPPVTLNVQGPSKVYTGVPFNVTITAVDGGGNTVTSYTGTVDFSSSDNQASLPGRYTFTSSDQGTHTFSVTLNSPGSQTVTITDIANESIDGNISDSVSRAPAHLRIDTIGETVAGAPFSVTVTAVDASNNTVTDYAGTVSFSTSDYQGIVPAQYTFGSSDQGVHTFSNEVTFKTAGNQSITATDTANLSVNGAATLAVDPAAADHLHIEDAGTTIAGLIFPVTIIALDPYNNTATSYVGTVSFGSSDIQAGLPAAYPFTSTDAGAHIFGVTLKTAGTQSLTVADTATPSPAGAGTSIVVSPGPVAQLAVTGYLNPTVAGVRHRFAVTAEDAYGNLVPTYRGLVTVRATDRRAIVPKKPYRFRLADQGTHSFVAMFKTAGSQALVAHARGLVSVPEAGITVLPGVPTKLLVSAPSKGWVAGQGEPVTVTLKDGFGNLATNYTGTVQFTSTDLQAVLPAPYPFTAGDAGRHTFTVVFKTAQQQRLVVTDTALPKLKVQVAGIQVHPAAAASFQLLVPYSVTVGQPFVFTILARDAFNNIATGYTGTVQFTSSDTQALLPVSVTFKSKAHGRQTAQVTFETLDGQTLTATDSQNNALTGTSGPILVIQ
jgi:hypothetical protein